jgi:hypothetical protein
VERRLLWHTLHVDGDAEVLDVLVPLLPQARYPMPPRAALHYDVRAGGDGWEVREEGDRLSVARTVTEARDAVYVRAHRRAFELASLAGWSRVHAATVDLDGVRLLVVGPSGAGKTTLAVRLLFDGVAVQGDESVLVHRTGVSLAVPRAFHLKDRAAEVVPELRRFPDLFRVEDVLVLDPARVRSPWELAEAPVDHVVLLERPARGGPVGPRAEPVPGPVVLEALLQQSFPVAESTAELVRTLSGALRSARGHRITGGDPAATVGALRRAIRYSAAIPAPPRRVAQEERT